MLIEIYSKDNCKFCDLAINQANNSGVDNVVIINKLGEDFTREELLIAFPLAKTYPQLKIDGKSIGGWTEFKNMSTSNTGS
tara:strand:- start:1002 stop:1244 length:243 start_codon:yes stop_codon:yes gene_type:complete